MSTTKKLIINTIENLEESTALISRGPAEDDLRQKIAEAAYYKAEKRGFEPGYDCQDWFEAETELLV